MAEKSPKSWYEPEGLANDEDERDEQQRGGTRVEHAFDRETAEALVAFVREQAGAPDGSGDWMPFALMAYDRQARDEERARARAGLRSLPAPEAILTPEQTAELLTIPKKTVIALCAQGRLEGAFKAGRRWRIPGRAVRRMAAGDQDGASRWR